MLGKFETKLNIKDRKYFLSCSIFIEDTSIIIQIYCILYAVSLLCNNTSIHSVKIIKLCK